MVKWLYLCRFCNTCKCLSSVIEFSVTVPLRVDQQRAHVHLFKTYMKGESNCGMFKHAVL